MIAGKTSWLAGAVLAAFVGSAPVAAQVGVITDEAEWARIVEAAKEEGLVRFYSAQAPDVLERLAHGFRQAYPEIEPEYLHIRGAQAMARMDQEREGGLDGADVSLNSALAWFMEPAREGALLPMGPAAVGWPEEWTAQENVPAIAIYPWIIAYNTELVPYPPTGYEDLLTPEWQGRIAITPPTGVNSAAFYDFLKKNVAEDIIPQLAAQNVKIYEGGDSNAQAVAAGEVWATMWSDPGGVRPLQELGAPIDLAIPSPGFTGQTYIAALGWSKRPHAAQVFVNWILSRDGQVAWHGADESSASPRFDDIPNSLSRQGFSMTDVTYYTGDVIREIREEFLAHVRD